MTQGHGKQHDDCCREGGIRGLNGNGKKYNKDYIKKKRGGRKKGISPKK